MFFIASPEPLKPLPPSANHLLWFLQLKCLHNRHWARSPENPEKPNFNNSKNKTPESEAKKFTGIKKNN